jgi:hypothetical protein
VIGFEAVADARQAATTQNLSSDLALPEDEMHGRAFTRVGTNLLYGCGPTANDDSLAALRDFGC